jgi:hypothetical protein
MSSSSESTNSPVEHSHENSTYKETKCMEELVSNLLPPSHRTSYPSSLPESIPPGCLANSLGLFTLPLLGDIVVTIPQGYSGEQVATFASSILQTPLFLRWIQKRYLTEDLTMMMQPRDNSELLEDGSAAAATAAYEAEQQQQQLQRQRQHQQDALQAAITAAYY